MSKGSEPVRDAICASFALPRIFLGEFEIEYLALAQRAMGQVGNEGLGEQKLADRAASGLYS